MMNWKRTILLGCVALSLGGSCIGADGFISLFDGKTLAGWNPLPGGKWEVVDGVIVGTQEKSEKRHGQLLSEKQYGDFVAKLKFKAIEGNSGFYFRVRQVDHAVAVKGFQAEIDPEGNGVGGLYETLGRAWVVKPSAEEVSKYFKPKKWNEMTVTAIGGDVTVTVNGVQTAQLQNDSGERRGFLGLQLHGGAKMHVMFKDIEIKPLDESVAPVIAEKIHDVNRALPPIVAPKSHGQLAESRKPPAGAVVLFDGTNLDSWNGDQWTIENGVMQTGPGDLPTKRSFGDCRLHVEWRIVDEQSHGNSGIYLMSLYEVQVFNSYQNHSKIYADGVAAAIYGQYPPLANVCRKPGEWEFYDITFQGPRFDAAGKLLEPARISLMHNGVLVQDNVALTGPTLHKLRPPYKQHAAKAPLYLQSHGNRLQFRNIWIVED